MTTTDQTPDLPDLETRRNLLTLLASDDGTLAWFEEQGHHEHALGMILQVIAMELIKVSAEHEQETSPAVKTLGAMVGGLFGISELAPMSDDEEDPEFYEQRNTLALRCYELRQRFLGLPAPT